MFSFKSLAIILATAAAVVTALPTVGSEALVKRVAVPAPVLEVRVPEPEPVALDIRAANTISDAINSAQSQCNSVFAQIDAAIAVKADVSVFVGLWGQIVDIIVALHVSIVAVINIGGLISVSVFANIFALLFASIAAKLQATIVVIAEVDIAVFAAVIVKLFAAVVANVNACRSIALIDITVIVNVTLVAAVNVFISVCHTLNISASVIASLQACIAISIGIHL